MPTAEKPATTKRETWADWLPHHEPTLLVDELLERVEQQGIECDLRTLRSWQTQGILPYPIRRRMGSGVHAVYPDAAVYFIGLLREMQGHGLKLQEIGPRLRAKAEGNTDRDLHHELIDKVFQAAAIQQQITNIPVHKVIVTFVDDVGMRSSLDVGMIRRDLIHPPPNVLTPRTEEMQ